MLPASDTCYMCDAPATTVEHAPPKCVFPEAKDLPKGVDLRKNLITVPSCDLHNLRASRDDEYFMVLLTTHYGNNQIGHNQFATKAVRALQRSEGFVAGTFRNAQQVKLNGTPTMAFEVDDLRFERVVDKTVRAIHFNHTGRKLLRPLEILSTAFRKTDRQLDHSIQGLGQTARALLAQTPKVGNNPDAFYHQLTPATPRDGGMMRLVFYGGFEILATWPRD